MPKTTEPQAPPAEILAKFEQIEQVSTWYCTSAKFPSSVSLIDGVWVVYRSEYKDPQWHLTQVLKTDARGIVKTSSGLNFSPNSCKYYMVTKKVDDNYNFPVLWSIDGIIECHQKKLLKDAESQHFQDLKHKISRLNAHKDTELIQALLEVLKSHGVTW